MYGYQKLELYCSQYKKLRTFVASNDYNGTTLQSNMTIHPAEDSNRKRKLKFRYNRNYLHSLIALIFCTVMSYWNPLQINIGALALSSSDSQLPASISSSSYPKPSPSRHLTEKLLNLDLGYNVLNSEMLRQGMGYSLETLDDEENNQTPAESRIDSFNRHDYGDDWESDYSGGEEVAEESLPTPQHFGNSNLIVIHIYFRIWLKHIFHNLRPIKNPNYFTSTRR
jgi:hypothetical protein